MITLDHIAVAARTLDEGAACVTSHTGLILPKGGEHPQMGTHNLLTTFGNDTYLEVIAPNPDAPALGRPRWFGLDEPPQPPRLLAWILRTDDIDACITKAAAIDIDLGTATPFKRDALRWRFSLRGDGSIPLGGAAPLIIQWDIPGPHPSNTMADLGLRLDQLTIETPHSDTLASLLNALNLENPPRLKCSNNTQITANLALPDGSRVVFQ